MSSDALLAKSETERDNEAVSGGSFVVTQTHLGFCPADVKLEIRRTGLVLLDDEHMVMSYPFTDIIMWSQNRAQVTIMLMKNLRRLVFTARSRWHAKRIVLKMHEVTDNLSNRNGAGRKVAVSPAVSDSYSLGEEELGSSITEAGRSMFRVQQTHLEDAPEVVMLIVDENGLRLLDRETGKLYQHILWFQLLLWRADAGAIVLILNHTDKQIELLTAIGSNIAKAMTAHALAVREALSSETATDSTGSTYPKAPLEFRRELMKFEAQHAAMDSIQSGISRRQSKCSRWKGYVFGVSAEETGRVQVREQLHAIFASVDTDGSGTIDLEELAALLKSFNIYNETTNRELSTNELQLLMIEMDAYDNAVTFDGFARWAMDSGDRSGGSSSNRSLASRFKHAVEHRQKEAEAVAEVFDKLDTDHDGLLDRTDFHSFCESTSHDITEEGFYRAWASLDQNRNGQITFKDFFTWYKSETFDAIASTMIRAIRTTRVLAAAKGAMAYAVDRRNAKAKMSLKAMFDSMDLHGTGDVGLVEMLSMVDDVGVDCSDKEVHIALTEMNSTGRLGGSITFDDLELWWCEPPNDTISGILRSKLKYAAFRAKAAGAVLTADAQYDGSEDAEKYINDSLAAAFNPMFQLRGKSLGVFGPTSQFRKRCQSLLYERQATQNGLVLIVVINLALLASATSGQESEQSCGSGVRGALPRYNFFVMVMFTAEAGMRIVVKGLYFAKRAYLSSWSWDAYDFTVLSITWVVFFLPADTSSKLHLTSNMYLFAPAGCSTDPFVDWLSMFRSLRMVRFFAQIRNIIAAVAEGRVMMASIVFLFFYLSVMFFVVGYQMYNGATSTQCLDSVVADEFRTNHSYQIERRTECVWDGDLTEGPDGQLREYEMCDPALLGKDDTGFACPMTIDCNRCVRKREKSASLERLQHVDKYGFDNYEASLLTLMALLTCDDWEKFTREYDREYVLSRALSWPFFFCFVVVSALFFVNLFVSGLAYSFIQIRADSRAKRERDRLKKLMVDTALQEGQTESTESFHKHILQILFPKLTRKAKDVLIDPRFAKRMTKVIVANLVCMMLDSWGIEEARQSKDGPFEPLETYWFEYLKHQVISVGEIFFTMAYTYEIMIKLQAIGFKAYFGAEDAAVLMSNVFDAVIVVTAWPETLMALSDFAFETDYVASMGSTSLSNFKILRAFRVMKLVFIIPSVESLALKAFKGLDTILSLVMLMVFVLTIAAIIGKNLFQDCQTEKAVALSEQLYGKPLFDEHRPHFHTFGQALMVVFQVMTADDWSPLMFKYMDCETWGSSRVAVSAFYFISLVTLCYFILSNLFIAIFIENFKLADEVKRDMQVKQLIEGLTMSRSGTDDASGNQWVQGLRDGIQGIENMLQETSHINVLRRRTVNEFMRGARVTGRVTKTAVSKAHRFTRGDIEQRRQTQLNQNLAKCCACFEKYRPQDKYGEMSQTDRVQSWKIKAMAKSGTLSPANGAWKRRPFHRMLQANKRYQRCVYLFILLSSARTTLREADGNVINPYQQPSDILLLLFFAAEFASMTIAYGFLGGPDYSIWPYKTTIFELTLLVTQFLTIIVPLNRPLHFLAASVQPFRVVRYMYMVDGFRVQIEGLWHAIAAVWSALFLLGISFMFFGIIGMELFKGKLYECAHDRSLDMTECKSVCIQNFETVQDSMDSWQRMGCAGNQDCLCDEQWKSFDFNFDNILEALKTLASVWSLAGWTQLFYKALDAPDRGGQPPSLDNSMVSAFLYFFAFILINSFLLTKLVTSMLCDFFAQKSGSDKTTDQRNWNFMSIFLVDALKLEVIKPPDRNRLGGLGLLCYSIIHHHRFKLFIDVVVVISVLATFVLQQLECESENGLSLACGLAYTVDTSILFVFWFEFTITLASVGRKQYLKNYQLTGFVLVTMSLDILWRLFAPDHEAQTVETRKIAMWLHTANCFRALRVITVLKRVNAIKKILFLVGVAADKVLTLFLLMTSVFLIFAFYASTLCHGVYDGDYETHATDGINDVNNFDTSRNSLAVLWQICTGQSMMGANRECAEWYAHNSGEDFMGLRSTTIYVFFVVFFFVANMLFLNLFIALLLDFDLMGSEDMAISDRDLLLFKKYWCDNETGKADIASGQLAEKRTIHSAIHLHELKDFVLRAQEFNVGTFSMMPRADRFYFNRVLYELKKTSDDVVESQRGTAVHTIPFFDLLYALCHIRFSSSCLSLAEEVEKSLEMIEHIENHAAQVIQVGARAFCARRSVNLAGDHAPPGCIWPVAREHHTEDSDAISHPGPDIRRCEICTLPNVGDWKWCSCAKIDTGVSLMTDSILDVQQQNARTTSVYKRRWDISVNCALLFELHSLIQTERLTPEHLVSEEYDRQAAQDRKRQGGFVGMIAANTTSHNPLTLFLTRSMRKREEKIDVQVLRGKHLMMEEKWDEAMKYFQEAIDLDADDAAQITLWRDECERRHRTAEAIRKRQKLQKQNRAALAKSKDAMGRSTDVKTEDSDLDQASLIAAVRAVFSLPRTTVVTNFSHMGTKENRQLVDPRDFMKGIVDLASTTRSTLTRSQLEAIMRTIDRMPCSDYSGGKINYRTFADMVSNLQSLNKFCDAVVDEGVTLKAELRKARKGKKSGGPATSDMKNSMFRSGMMSGSLDMLMSQDSMQGGSSLDENQDSDDEDDGEEIDTKRFHCPLTKQLMVDPVLACDGHSYERLAFLNYWSDHGQTVQMLEKRMSPVTGEIMDSDETQPNAALRKEIAEWKQSEEIRAKRKAAKDASIKERTRRLRQQSEDTTRSLHAPEGSGRKPFQTSVLGDVAEPLDASSDTHEDRDVRATGKPRWGLGWTANERDFDEHKADFQQFANPLSSDGSSTVMPTADADSSRTFEREAPVPLATLKKSSSVDGKKVHANPMVVSIDSTKSDEDGYFEIEGTVRPRKSKKKRGKLSGFNPFSALKKSDPEVIARYKVLHNTPCHEAPSVSSEILLAGLYEGEVISVIDRVRTDGTIRVQCERGWASVATPEGELQLELIDESGYWYAPQNAVDLREDCDHRSKKASFLLKGVDSIATMHREIRTEIENGEIKIDVWVKCDDGKGTAGWASIKDEKGIPQLQYVDRFDELRFHLRKLSLEALIRQAMQIEADPNLVQKATNYNRCIDPRNALVEIIKDLYETTVPVLDLKELPPGWDGSETGRLAEGERVRVNAYAGLQEDPTSVAADVQALHDKRGYVLYEIPLRGLHGSYEVKIDRIGRTVVLPRENLIRQEDEKANKGLFSAVLVNDADNLRKLIERTEKPSDALARSGEPVPRLVEPQLENLSDIWRAEPGVLRVIETVNSNDRDFDREYFDKTLYQVSCLRASEQHEPLAVKQLLMEKILLKAVVQDDIETAIGLFEEDRQLYVLPLLRSFCSTSGPWATNPPTSLLALARQIWKDGGYGHHGGMANTMEAAEHLGGKCWLFMSKKFQDEFAEEFDPDTHTVERMQQMHSALTKKAMKRRFGAKESAAASEEQTEKMLEWKSRQFA